MKKLVRLSAAQVFVASVLMAAAGHAVAAPRVALLAADGAVTGGAITDPVAKIQANGTFDAVDVINVQSPNPTPLLSELLAYDAVLVWSNQSFTSGTALGDVLADYVDAGGGVVLAVFVNTTTTANRFLDGRWVTGNYSIIVPQGGGTTTNSLIGTPDLPSHPIMSGVVTFDPRTSSRPTSTALTSHGLRVCPYADGRTLIAVSTQFPRRVDLGFHPPSNGSGTTTRWDQTTDGGKILANALLYAATNIPATGVNLRVSGSAPASCTVAPGGTLTYSINVRNIASTTSAPAVLTVDLPPASSATFSSATPVPTSVTPTQLVIPLGALALNQPQPVTIQLTAVGGNEPAPIVATASSADTDNDPADNAVSLTTTTQPAPVTTGNAFAVFSSNIALDNSLIPGGGGRFTTFDTPVASADGSWWAIRADTDQATAQDSVTIRKQVGANPPTIALQEGVTVMGNGAALGLYDLGLEINNSGVIAFSGDDAGATTGDEFVAVTDGSTVTDIAREGQTLDGALLSTSSGSAQIFNNGQAAFYFTANPTTNNSFYTANGTTVAARVGVTAPAGLSNSGGTGLISSFTTNTAGDGGLLWDATGTNSIYVGAASTGSTTTDNIVVANGTVVIQEGITTGLGATSTPNGTTKTIGMSPDGLWTARGSNTVSAEDWVAIGTGTAISKIIKSGDPAFVGSALTWREETGLTGTFFTSMPGPKGLYIVGGITDAPSDWSDVLYVLNDKVVIARENDPVDLNGDGLFNDNVYIRTLGDDEVAFIEDGRAALLTVSLRDAQGALCELNNTSVGEALVRIALPVGACCSGSTCTFSLQVDCTTGFQGIGTTCGPTTCGGPATAVCCRGTTSILTSSAACTAPAGVGVSFLSGNSTVNGTSNTSPCCYADFNKDASRNIDDIFIYLNAWFGVASNPFAKINGDGVANANIDDLFVFINVWFAGGCG